MTLKRQIILTAVVFALGSTAGPLLAGSHTWQDTKGVLQMSNIGTLVPKENRIPSPPARTAPKTRDQAPSPDLRSQSATDAEIERVQTAIDQLQDRNRKVLELKQWFFKLMNDPNQFYDPSFIDWLRRIIETDGSSPLARP